MLSCGRKLSKIIAITLVLALFVSLFASCAPVAGPTHDVDYSNEENWAYFAEGEGNDADLFLICPTVDMGKGGNYNMSLDDEDMKESFVGALNMERGIYEGSAIMYAPYYRQMTFPVYSLTDEEMQPYFDLAYSDIKAAFEFYMENLNCGRPIILAGFSQGSQLLVQLLKDYFDNPEYSEKLVAAYAIGWRVTEEEIMEYPHLKMAEGMSDTGVIISFNSEAAGVTDSIMVPEGTRTLGINPLNWKSDSTLADASLNIGACFTSYSGEIKKEISALTGAYLDPARGTLILPDIDPAEYSNSLFPDGVYHLYDYQFFFRSLETNVAHRLAEYLVNKK